MSAIQTWGGFYVTVMCLLLACADNQAPARPDARDTAQDSSDTAATVDTDEPEAPITPTCIDEDGDEYGEGCAAGFDCNDDSTAVHEGAVELCDDIDNNCDDDIDETCPCLDGTITVCYSAEAETLGLGRCHAGWQTCESGEITACQSEVLPTDEACDSLDNNCDGDVDEGLTNDCGLCGALPAETCSDMLDNNCDGTIDESEAGCDCDGREQQPCYSGPPHTLGRGACRGGYFDCEDVDWGRCRGEVVPTEEVCDGIDNDCDGLTDEALSNSCGQCGVPDPREVCDGEDDDCDGLVDEGLRLLCGLCSAGQLEEACDDGLDNDCDADVDEGCPCTGDPGCYPGPPDTRGVGACHDGTRTCDRSGEFWQACTGYATPQPEVCDNEDNDCDGLTDISAAGCDVCNRDDEVCDGVDNDCDGRIDEFLRNPCGDCYEDVTPEEDCGPTCCNGEDDDCDGWTDETLINACGTCGEPCYDVEWSAGAGTLAEGALNGLDEDISEGLRLGTSPFVYPYLWVANSGEASVTKINTITGTVVDTYSVRVSPSRTAVDLDGDAWIANQDFEDRASVTQIQAEDCEGELCVLFTQPVGDEGDIASGLAIDENNHAWVGTYDGRELIELENETGLIIDTYDVGIRVFGLAVDSEGTIWISNLETPANGTGKLSAFNIAEQRVVEGFPRQIPDCSNPYGIAVDARGHVWLGNSTCDNLVEYDPEAETFHAYPSDAGTMDYVRGVAVDDAGNVWAVARDSDRLGRFDPDEDNPGEGSWETFETCNQPMGVGITGEGTIWTPCYTTNPAVGSGCQDGGCVFCFDQLGQRCQQEGEDLVLEAGIQPFSYSDMTGFQLRTFTAHQGTWTVVFDCGYDVCSFDSVDWNALLPSGTAVRVRVRSSTDGETWSSPEGPFEAAPALLEALPDGRYAEIQVTLVTDERDITPIVDSISVGWQRP